MALLRKRSRNDIYSSIKKSSEQAVIILSSLPVKNLSINNDRTNV